ncbi:hypothetical protein [Methylobacterium goesingense]|uniref:Uncharacterized protein n=1 Tax=Methylobacterium goesingense TaxID=243690 RepID=A0ABV2L663_9HYPH|nr:hypothetical protein [Methylobacterium goesingense]GJD72423.1 hypothetical protein CFIICLFH_0637 [Methylobacterium goesingense]
MSFFLRAALVIGFLSWLALQRQGPAAPALVPDRAEVAAAALDLWEALPEEARADVLHGGGAEVIRRVAGPPPSSRDTLSDSDRKPPWRGAQSRRDGARVAERGERSIP